MFVIVKYFNYRKDGSFALVGSAQSLEEATNIAREMATQEAAIDKDEVTEGEPNDVYIDAEGALVHFCVGDGVLNYVFAVIPLP